MIAPLASVCAILRAMEHTMTLMIETITPPDRGTFRLDLQLATDIRVSAETARKSVSAFVGREIGDLLHGDRPDLVWGASGVFWRVPVILSSRSFGRVGRVGAVDVNVETGELNLSDDLILLLSDNAHRLAAGAAL